MTTIAPIKPHAEICRALLYERQVVGNILGFARCANAVWDMLLYLYVAKKESRVTHVWALCLASNIPVSSAHRRVAAMIEDGSIVRTSDDGDRRRVAVALSPDMEEKLDRVMDRLGAHLQTLAETSPR